MEAGAGELWAAPRLKEPPPGDIGTEDSASAADQDGGSRSSASTPSLSSLSQQSSLSLDWQPAPAPYTKHDARAINTRIMLAQSPHEVLHVVSANLGNLDSINTTAALQRLAKLLPATDPVRGCRARREQASQAEPILSSPVFHALVGLIVAQCTAGYFNAQSTCNAWWAVAKLHSMVNPAPTQLVAALEGALIGCLSAPRECDRPNAQACSSLWWSWGRIAGAAYNGYMPSPAAIELMWDRTKRLSLAFDPQGASNMLWAFGLLCKRHGHAFPIRTDVLASMAFVVARLASGFTEQGFACSVVGCSNLGLTYRAYATPIVHLLVAQSLHCITSFNMQSMANMALALTNLGASVLSAERTRLLLAGFDAHAVAQPLAAYRHQDGVALAAALRAAGLYPARFNPAGVPPAIVPPPPPPLPSGPPPAEQQEEAACAPLVEQPEEAFCLCDSTNQPSRSTTAALSVGVAGALPSWMAACAGPLGRLAGLEAAAGVQARDAPPPPPPPPPPRRAAAPPPMPSHSRLARFAALLPPGGTSGPLSISDYTALAQQLAAAVAGGTTGRPYAGGPLAPPPQALPLPHAVLVARPPPAVAPGSSSTAVHGQYTATWQEWGGQYTKVQPPPPAPASTAASSDGGSDPDKLQAILAALQQVQLRQQARAVLQASDGFLF